MSHLIILLKLSCVCCDGLSAFLCPKVHSVSDEHHKVLGIKCLLLNQIKWISFPFHNIIMSQKPFFSALYIFFLITSYHGLFYLSQLHCLISLWGKRKKWLLFLVVSFKDILHRKKLVWNKSGKTDWDQRTLKNYIMILILQRVTTNTGFKKSSKKLGVIISIVIHSRQSICVPVLWLWVSLGKSKWRYVLFEFH